MNLSAETDTTAAASTIDDEDNNNNVEITTIDDEDNTNNVEITTAQEQSSISQEEIPQLIPVQLELISIIAQTDKSLLDQFLMTNLSNMPPHVILTLGNAVLEGTKSDSINH